MLRSSEKIPFDIAEPEFCFTQWAAAKAAAHDTFTTYDMINVILDCKLTEHQKTLFEMRYQQGMRMTEIADELNINISTVSRQLTRIKQKLQPVFTKWGFINA